MVPENRVSGNASRVPILLHDRPVGYVAGDTFHKTLSARRHFLRRPRAIAFNRCTLVDAERAGATLVRIFETDNRDTYTAPIADVWRFGLPVHRGYGDQVALSLDRWTINGRAPAQRFVADPRTNQERKQAQLSLFDQAVTA